MKVYGDVEPITFENIFQHKDMVCDIELKDMSFPMGLFIEREAYMPTNSVDTTIEHVYADTPIDELLFMKLMKAQSLKRKVGKTKKNRPLKLSLSLKRRIK